GGLRFGRVRFKPRDRQETLDDNPLRHYRLELVVDEIDARRIAGGELLDRRIRDVGRVAERHLLEDADGLVAHVEAAAAEEVSSFAANQAERNVAAGRLVEDELARRFDDIRLEAAAQTAIG